MENEKGHIIVKITIIRHEKVDMTWKKKYNSAAYDSACQKYDACPVIPASKAVLEEVCNKPVYISELSRTYETGCRLFGEIQFIRTPLLNEVTIRAFTDTKNRYPLWLWNFMGRCQWLLQNKRQAEGKADTVIRAREMIGLLEEKKEDCYIITHGFYMRTLIRQMKKQGYQIKGSTVRISNLDRIYAVKQ